MPAAPPKPEKARTSHYQPLSYWLTSGRTSSRPPPGRAGARDTTEEASRGEGGADVCFSGPCQPPVPLMGRGIRHPGPQRLAPADRVAAMARMAVIGRAAHFRDQAGNHVGRAAEAGAGENQRLAADIVMAAVRPAQPHAAHGAVGVGEQAFDNSFGEDRDAGGLDRKSTRLNSSH